MSQARRSAFDLSSSERLDYEQTLLRLMVSAQIENFLEETGLSQVDLAKRMGKSKAWVSKLLSGSQNATLDTLAEVALALGLRWDARLSSASRRGTPAERDPDPPDWTNRAPTAHQSSIVSLFMRGSADMRNLADMPIQPAVLALVRSFGTQRVIHSDSPATPPLIRVATPQDSPSEFEEGPMMVKFLAGAQ